MATLTSILTSWPFWISVVIVVGLYMFRPQIGERVSRLRWFGPAGFDGGPKPEQQAERAAQHVPGELGAGGPAGSGEQVALPGLEPARAAADALLDGLRGPHFVATQRRIVEDLERRGIAGSLAEMNRVLLQFATLGAVLADFERLYDVIYGSQIDVLRELATRPMPRAETARYFEVARATWPDFYGTATAEQHVGFLIGIGLAQAASVDGIVSITDKGRSFLMFLIARGKGRRIF
jgi:hypothetical protein